MVILYHNLLIVVIPSSFSALAAAFLPAASLDILKWVSLISAASDVLLAVRWRLSLEGMHATPTLWVSRQSSYRQPIAIAFHNSFVYVSRESFTPHFHLQQVPRTLSSASADILRWASLVHSHSPPRSILDSTSRAFGGRDLYGRNRSAVRTSRTDRSCVRFAVQNRFWKFRPRSWTAGAATPLQKATATTSSSSTQSLAPSYPPFLKSDSRSIML